MIINFGWIGTGEAGHQRLMKRWITNQPIENPPAQIARDLQYNLRYVCLVVSLLCQGRLAQLIDFDGILRVG
jgi:hypothetical protein